MRVTERPDLSGLGRLTVFAAAVCAAAAPAAVHGQEQPLSVTYGARAPTVEGDHDHREVILLTVPEGLRDRLYLRVFDADVGGEHDRIFGTAEDTETRFTLFGGDGALTGAVPSDPDPVDEALTAGEPIAERSYTANAALDGRWSTLAAFSPEQGELVDGRRAFRLLVEGTAGDDANLYSVTLSLRDRRNLPPEGLEVFSFVPTVRVPTSRSMTELRFLVPPEAERLVVRNFDAAGAEVALATGFRSVPLAASGQDDWAESEVELADGERGRPAAIVFRGGGEIPNDVTFFTADGGGRPVRMDLPARAWRPNTRPVPEADVEPLADCASVAFDAVRSTDADGDALSYAWEFGDGAAAEGRTAVHRYPGPGTYRATLRVTDSSGQVGNGAAREVEVFVKRPPTAVAAGDLVVAPGEPVAFDGSRSRGGDRPIARYLWDFGDGTTAEGRAPVHAFGGPGRYVVALRVEDDSAGPPCNAGTGQQVVRVNAPPVAEAGADQHVAVGETVTLDGGRSYDVDGAVTAYAWDPGDGTEPAAEPVVRHAFAIPGVYTATLTVRDDAGVANGVGSDTVRVVVNAPPVAEAGPDRRAAIGEVLAFDGSASADPDGTLVGFRWDFGDGSRGDGARVAYAYRGSGTYRVTLTVRDDSLTGSDTDTDGLTVVVNEPPVAAAGPDQVVTASEVRFDGTGSVDPDGAIARYEWDFGDGATGLGPTPTHVYTKPGEYLVRLTVTDDSGTVRSSASDGLRVLVNTAPIADAGPDLIGAPGQELRFVGAGSIDPDGDVVDFLWDFRDGTTAAERDVTHGFAEPGIYHVRLTVRDDTGDDNAIDFDEARVVINAPPVADAGPDILAAPGDSVRFDAGNSFDIDGGIADYRWDFSDREEFTPGREVVRTYDAPGVYTARLTVTDGSGAINATARDEVVIRINHAPVASAGSDVVTSSNTVTLDAARSADADGDPLTYRWDFGDGTPPAGGVKVAHTYADGGTYPVILTVDDGTGLANATHVAAVTVAIDRPPVADAGRNREVCSGDIVVLDGSGSRDPEGGLLLYGWDFGDGTTADIVNPTKTYETRGIYPVTLTVEDESGFPGNVHTDRVVVRVDESPIAEAGPDQ
ncbi:MAG TPA: PKD domain-containing protein, partial [Geminicoccaceae bacterium]|nr:PKD domain-containing protein [Geminicoccaceae bacterium]